MNVFKEGCSFHLEPRGPQHLVNNWKRWQHIKSALVMMINNSYFHIYCPKMFCDDVIFRESRWLLGVSNIFYYRHHSWIEVAEFFDGVLLWQWMGWWGELHLYFDLHYAINEKLAPTPIRPWICSAFSTVYIMPLMKNMPLHLSDPIYVLHLALSWGSHVVFYFNLPFYKLDGCEE